MLQNTRSRRLSAVTGLRSIPFIVLIALMGVVIVSCDEEDQRAVPPGTVRDFATVAAEASPEGDAGESPGVLDDAVHGINLPLSERVYFARGSDIWQAPVQSEPEPVAENLEVIDFSASATGHRLALLQVERDDVGEERTVLSILLPDGAPLFDLSRLDDDDVDLDGVSPISSVAMSPDGNALAMTHQNGAMTMASLAGDARHLVESAEDQHPGRLSWSSDGRFIAYLDPWMPDEPSALYVVVPESGVRQIMVEPSSSGHGVIRAEWIPGTSYIIYIKASGATISHGGDVFALDVTTGEHELLMASGEFAPVAGIVDIAPSPDGMYLAATAFVPGDEYPAFSGLWTIDLRSGERAEVDVEDVHSVTDIWWLEDRLLFRTIDEPRTRLPGTYTGQEAFKLMEYSPQTGETEERYAEESD